MEYDPDGIFTCTHKMCSVNGGVSSHPLAFALMFLAYAGVVSYPPSSTAPPVLLVHLRCEHGGASEYAM